ncbi:DUF1798 family protein [Virgibacillus halodenitrificans]|uniref:DUF1798 family protein n=1 Tax=Virgibacillus halodenitrificans TaxID=1482 RepID=A0AAC9J0G5_VIRHA|nr:DUF1798 family protein [Virgibacillus halodenitrificans]APC48469.1 hypothetical protein BME96_09920 [Virgibacillus halodenitrificans]MBD1222574.1 DUF1798 family protein [Virgibacillus halodenitrificans]MCG1028342.1 DUF1798 family protein [Virgibacillus halodenitrificans]MCJ0931043.1 YppE family protein [Virgibacillus halodenitrificans]MEC2160431.1 DUF1798 family protein [Virgibacillus halodenitrificans]
MDLQDITKTLKHHLIFLKHKYEMNEPPASMRDKAFFQQVKEETNPIYDLLEEWEALGLQTVKERKVNVHPHQITSTKENMELVLLHSYYVDVRRKRYMELYNSITYIFDQLIEELQ